MVLLSAAATSVAVVVFPNSGLEVPTVPGFSSIAVIFVLLSFPQMLVLVFVLSMLIEDNESRY